MKPFSWDKIVRFCDLKLHRYCAVASFSILFSFGLQAEPYSLEEAVRKAQSQDIWLEGSRSREESLNAMSVQSGTLPDPKVSLSVANLPTDSFDFSQEPMTQMKVSVSQMFPRGATRQLQKKRWEQLALVQPYARESRSAEVALAVSEAWLEAYRSQRTIEIIQKKQDLFDYLVGVAESGYASALSNARQQDVIRAQLERTRLEDRLTRLLQQYEVQKAQLGEWLFDAAISIALKNPDLKKADLSEAGLIEALSLHPKIKVIEQKVRTHVTSIKLAEQQYKPQWGVNASYGYRDDDLQGRDRADFLSLGISFDVPLFANNRQDKQVQAAKASADAVKTEKSLLLRQLKAGYEGASAKYRRLLERKNLFDARLLREMEEQAEASLNAYTNDNGDFSEVVRARIAELNARIEALNINVDIQKSISKINYFLAGSLEVNMSSVAANSTGIQGQLDE